MEASNKYNFLINLQIGDKFKMKSYDWKNRNKWEIAKFVRLYKEDPNKDDYIFVYSPVIFPDDAKIVFGSRIEFYSFEPCI